jgi:hypothetical protein
VSAERTFFVSAAVADTIHTIRKIIVYWYQFSKIKKTDPDRSPTRCRPRRPSLGCAVREEPPSPCARRRSCHQGRQWSPSPCAVEEAYSRSVSIHLRSGRSAPLGLEPPPQASIHAVTIVGDGREEAHAAWPLPVGRRRTRRGARLNGGSLLHSPFLSSVSIGMD